MPYGATVSLRRGAELLAVSFESPGGDLFVVGEDERPHADDLVVLHVDEDRAATVADVGADLLGHQRSPASEPPWRPRGARRARRAGARGGAHRRQYDLAQVDVHGGLGDQLPALVPERLSTLTVKVAPAESPSNSKSP